MKRLIIIAMLLFASSVYAGERYIQPYYQDRDHDGYRETPVQGHWRGEPDGVEWNNREYQRQQEYQERERMPTYQGDPYFIMKRNNRFR